jgi:hypothetical protein
MGVKCSDSGILAISHIIDFHLDTLLNLPNVVADSYSSTLDAIVMKLQLVFDFCLD